ncbi:MAG: undecaprenyl-diphosphate phosphatase [Chloroflexi bacterium]|nr:undecaprenyl-diphosphate phosphatase [Chloroflexota bacterium]
MPDWLAAIVLGLVEGITEFIPVSSTGHLIIAGHLIGFEGDRASTFEIFIQLGAILAVVFLYWDRFVKLIPTRLEMNPEQGFSGLRGLLLLALTTVPAVSLGALGHSTIKNDLFSPTTVAIGLAVGGLAILLIEPRLPQEKYIGLDSLTWRVALLIGLFQCLSLWPGMSRAAMTILGAMIIGVERKTAAEYSFFVAVPALCAAVGYDMLKSISSLQGSDAPIFAIGFVVAFISAWFAVRVFIRLLGSHSLQPFGWYRIVVAGAVLLVL